MSWNEQKSYSHCWVCVFLKSKFEDRIAVVLKTNYMKKEKFLPEWLIKLCSACGGLLPPPDPLLTTILSLAMPLTCDFYKTQKHVGSFTLQIYWI